MKNLQRLIFKRIIESVVPKRDLAERLGVSLFGFEQKVLHKDFDLEDAKLLKLDADEVLRAVEKDFKAEFPSV